MKLGERVKIDCPTIQHAESEKREIKIDYNSEVEEAQKKNVKNVPT